MQLWLGANTSSSVLGSLNLALFCISMTGKGDSHPPFFLKDVFKVSKCNCSLAQTQPIAQKHQRLKKQLQRYLLLFLLQRNLKPDRWEPPRAGQSLEVDNCQKAITEVTRQPPSGTPESVSTRVARFSGVQNTDHRKSGMAL